MRPAWAVESGLVDLGGPWWTYTTVRSTNMKSLPARGLMRLGGPGGPLGPGCVCAGDWGSSSPPHAGGAGADAVWVDEVHQVHQPHVKSSGQDVYFGGPEQVPGPPKVHRG